MINKCIFIGRLTSDPETRYTQGGDAVCSINLAVNEKWKNGEHTEFVRVSFFGKLAEIAGQYLTKGQQAYVEGRMRTRKYTDKEGIERSITEINGDVMKMLGGKQDAKPSGGGNSYDDARGGRSAPSSAPNLSDMDDDIPF